MGEPEWYARGGEVSLQACEPAHLQGRSLRAREPVPVHEGVPRAGQRRLPGRYKRGYLDEIFDCFMKRSRDEALAEAAACEDLQSFYLNCRDAWRSAQEGGFLDKVKLLLLPDLEEIGAAADQAKVREDFRVRFGRQYRAAVDRSIIEIVNARFPEARREWTVEEARVEAARFNDYTDFYRTMPGLYWAEMRHEWLPEICGRPCQINLRR